MNDESARNLRLKSFVAMMVVCNESLKSKRLKLMTLHRRRQQRLSVISTLIHGLIKPRRSRRIFPKKRYGKFWELDVPKNDENFFKEHFRMSRASFNILCEELKGIAKKDTKFRMCIPLDKRIAIALYILASTAEYSTVGRLFGVSKSIVGSILQDFYSEVWKVLAPKFLKSDFLTQDKVQECVKGFEKVGFPQCLGAIDGCHIEIRPGKADACDYYNCKGWYSMVLLALVDHRFRFMYINVGAPGSCNDSQILEISALKKVLNESALLKENSKIINGVRVPVFIIGDAAFRFSTQLMKPFPFSVLADEKERTFNNHLAKAKRVVENSFGLLKARFPRIGKGVDNSMGNATGIIKCCCVLHNFLIERNDEINNIWAEKQRQYESGSNLIQPVATDSLTDHNINANDIRNAIASSLGYAKREFYLLLFNIFAISLKI